MMKLLRQHRVPEEPIQSGLARLSRIGIVPRDAVLMRMQPVSIVASDGLHSAVVA